MVGTLYGKFNETFTIIVRTKQKYLLIPRNVQTPWISAFPGFNLLKSQQNLHFVDLNGDGDLRREGFSPALSTRFFASERTISGWCLAGRWFGSYIKPMAIR